jgi:hypothetical protein
VSHCCQVWMHQLLPHVILWKCSDEAGSRWLLVMIVCYHALCIDTNAVQRLSKAKLPRHIVSTLSINAIHELKARLAQQLFLKLAFILVKQCHHAKKGISYWSSLHSLPLPPTTCQCIESDTLRSDVNYSILVAHIQSAYIH